MFRTPVFSQALVNDQLDIRSQLDRFSFILMTFPSQAISLLMAVSAKTSITFDLSGDGTLETAQGASNPVKRFSPFSFNFDIVPLGKTQMLVAHG